MTHNKIASVGYVVREVNAANWCKRNTRQSMTGWERQSTGNCARDWNLNKLTNGIIHKPESVLQNETHKIQMDHAVLARRQNLALIKKELSSQFLLSQRITKWNDRQILGPCQRAEESMEHESDGDINSRWSIWNGSQKPGKRLGKLEMRGRIETIHTTELLKSA